MFYNYALSGSCIWEGNTIDNLLLKSNVQKYATALDKFRSGDTPVALCLSRGPIAVYCMLGLLEIGIPFLTIDKTIPLQRVIYMLETVGAKYLITDIDIPYEGVTKIKIGEIDWSYSTSCQESSSSDIAYYMCTSGTTGRPKAVKVLRSGLANFFDGISSCFSFDSEMRFVNLTSYSFDIVFLELFYSLYNGLCVVLTSDDDIADVKRICNIIVQNDIEIIQITPSRFKMILLVDNELNCLKKIKYILMGGEAFPKDFLPILKKTPARVFNMYGPTETTIWSSVSELTNAESVNVGTPIANTSFFIVDENKKVLENEKEGEICIGGAGLAAGYINDADANTKAFVYLDVCGKQERVYKTGDVGMIDRNGMIHCFGRIDNQIKLNGHRIELEDIDRNIAEMGIVNQSSTCYDKSANRLVTFYINDNIVSNAEFIEGLRKALPEIMVPKCYIQVPKFDYTVSGKFDQRGMLNKLCQQLDSKYADTNDERKNKFMEIVERHVEVPFSEESRLDELIFDSISFVQLLVELEEAFSFEFDISALDASGYTYVEDLYSYINNNAV